MKVENLKEGLIFKAMIKLEIVLIGTGLDASNLNGMVVIPNCTIANATRSK